MTVPEGREYVALVRGQRLDQPGPGDLGEERVGGEVGRDLGAGVGHAAEGAAPGVVAGGVVQQHEAAGAGVVAVDGHVGRERRGEGRDALRRRHLLAEHLGTQPGSAHLRDGVRELRGSRGRVHTGLVTCGHGVTLGRHAASWLPTRGSERPLATPLRGWPGARDSAADLASSPFLRAARGEPVPHTPVWFMRQAGRSLPEYRKLREGVAMLESCMRPDLITEITLQPVRRYGVDAAIFFSDIVLPAQGGRGRPRHQARGRAGGRPAGAHARRRRRDPRPDPRARPLHHRGGPHARRRARGDAAHRVRRRAVHRRVVPRRGRAVEGARAHQGDDVRRSRRLGRADGARSPASRRRTCGCRWRPAPRRCSCSTPGPARWRRRTTSPTSCRSRRGCSRRPASSGCRGSTSGSAPASCSA